MRRAHRRGHGFGYGWGPYGYGYDGWYGHDSWHDEPCHGRRGFGGRRRSRWMLHALFARIDASPAQERAIVAEIDKLQERVHGAKTGLADARGDLAAALRGKTLDDAALGAALGRVDASSTEVRAAVIDALRAIHGVLDDKQRATLADMLDTGRGFWRMGPYR